MFLDQVKPILKEKKKVVVNSSTYIAFAISIMLIVLVSYIYNFSSLGLSTNQSEWAQFGDYFGGVLNPILAFLAFLALLKTISLQSKAIDISKEELSATRQELEKSRIAQEEQSKSLQLQNKATYNQMLENTFFKLLELFVENRNNIKYDNKEGKESVFFIYSRFQNRHLKSYNDIKATYDEFNTEMEQYTGTYFGQAYQVINFIDSSGIDDKERYSKIFRAQLSQSELKLLFFHCLGSIGTVKFKKLVEKFSLLRHLVPDEYIESNIVNYSKSAFLENEYLIKILSQEINK